LWTHSNFFQNLTAMTDTIHRDLHHLFIDFKKASDSVEKVVLYNILIEFGYP
jgi:hypothetical protein